MIIGIVHVAYVYKGVVQLGNVLQHSGVVDFARSIQRHTVRTGGRTPARCKKMFRPSFHGVLESRLPPFWLLGRLLDCSLLLVCTCGVPLSLI